MINLFYSQNHNSCDPDTDKEDEEGQVTQNLIYRILLRRSLAAVEQEEQGRTHGNNQLYR